MAWAFVSIPHPKVTLNSRLTVMKAVSVETTKVDPFMDGITYALSQQASTSIMGFILWCTYPEIDMPPEILFQDNRVLCMPLRFFYATWLTFLCSIGLFCLYLLCFEHYYIVIDRLWQLESGCWWLFWCVVYNHAYTHACHWICKLSLENNYSVR